MKIFGIGLSRTGTLSLAVALRELGYNTAHYPKPPLLPGLIDVMNGYDAGCDVPIAIAYKELDKAFPNSKFILTTRSLKTWLGSCRRFRHFRVRMSGDSEQVRLLLYGYNGYRENKFRETYLRHHKDVLEYFKDRNDLLIIDITKGEGWKELCEFLNKEIPDKPFPHRHRSK